MSINAEAECNSCGIRIPLEQSIHWIMINPLTALGVPIGKPMHLCREKCIPEFAAKYPGAELAAFLVETAARAEVATRRVQLDVASDGPVSPRLVRTTITIKQNFEWFRPRQIVIPGGTADAPLEQVKHPVTGHPYPVRTGAESAKDWVISDYRIGNRSVFSQAGDVAGDVLREMAEMDFECCQADMTMSIDVRYIGKNPEGEVFTASIIGDVPDVAGGAVAVESKTTRPDVIGWPANEVVAVDATTRVPRGQGPIVDVQSPIKALPSLVQPIAKNLAAWFSRFDEESHRITKRAPAMMLRMGALLEVAYVGPDDKIELIVDPAMNNNVLHAQGGGMTYNIVKLVLAHTRKLAVATHPPRYVIRVIDPAEPFLPAKKRDEAKLVFEMPAGLRGVAAMVPEPATAKVLDLPLPEPTI